MPKKTPMTSSQEDYLETIYHITAEKQGVRAKDIAREMKVKASSVTGALRVLSDKGLINYEPYGVITMTPEGRDVAEEVVRRHEVLDDFFSRILGIAPEEAEAAACGMEHALSQPVLDRLIQFIHFLDLCPRVGKDWIESFRDFCREGVMEERCVSCVFQGLERLKKKRSDRLREDNPPVSVNELEPGRQGRIAKIKGRGQVLELLAGMDLVPGNIIEIEESKGDTLEVRVKGYHRSLRLDDAQRILVDPL